MRTSFAERIAVLVSGSGTNLQALLDHPVCELDINPQLIAAQRIEALRRTASVRKRAEIAWPLAVIDDHVLVEVAQFVAAHRNTSWTLARPATSASFSVTRALRSASTQGAKGGVCSGS